MDKDGDQPLHDACEKGHTGTVGVLVAQRADVNALNKHGLTPLHKAASGDKDCPELCEILLKHGASINAMEKDGDQPLHVTCYSGHTRTVGVLVAQRADVNALDKHGLTPLHRAACGQAASGDKDCPELCEILLKHGASINAMDEGGNQPLHDACNKGHTKTVGVLVAEGADVNALNKHGQTPVHTAACGDKDCPELCETLLKHGVSINAMDEDGNQPLHEACNKGHTKTVGVLVAQKADVNALNKHGQTPVHTAACGDKDCPELFNAMDKDGDQPLQ
jgi:ankyrin repeat protein